MAEDYVICPLCGGKFGSITIGHLKTHYGGKGKGLMKRFRFEFPDAVLVSKRARQRRSESLSGEKNPMWGVSHKGKDSPVWGRKHSDAAKKKMSEALRGNQRRLGIPHTEETKRRMSETHKGWHHSEETKRKIGESNRGKIVSEVTKKRISESRMGEKNWNWRGGVFRFYDECFTERLRRKIRRRDGFCCQLCSKSVSELDRDLSVHHIDYDKKNSDPANLIALCCSCHMKTITNCEYWTVYFQGFMDGVRFVVLNQFIRRMMREGVI